MRRHFLIALLVVVVLTAGAVAFPMSVTAQEPEQIAGDALVAPDDPGITGQAIGPLGQPGYYATSEFMVGRVAVGIILVESDGSIDLSTEDRTEEEKALVRSEVEAACNWWAAREPRANLEFVYEVNVLPTGYEPINRSHSDQGLWIGQAMGQLGYSASSYFTRVRDYDNALRSRYGADWAFTIFVVDSSNDGDNKFSDGYFAYAYLGGPFMVMTYGNNGYGPSNMDAVAAHEMGHIFRALDQYYAAHQACTYRSGYLYVENQNSQYGSCASNESSIMRGLTGPYYSGAVDLYARGQVGWRDSDGDDVLDPVDTTLAITLEPQAENPRAEGPVTYFGSVEDTPWDSPTRPDVSINSIASVKYRLNRGPWLPTAAGDGAFDGQVEGYAFTTAHLTSGVYAVDVRATGRFGNTAVAEAADVLLVGDGGEPTSYLDPYQPDPTTETALAYTGWAVATSVSDIQWRNGGDWVGAAPVDGAFDSPVEEFTFATGQLAPGTYVFEARVIVSGGQVEETPASDEVTVEARVYQVYLPIVLR